MKQLTDLQYGILMQALETAKYEIGEDTFIDPYDNEQEITNDQAMQAILEIEDMHITHFTS